MAVYVSEYDTSFSRIMVLGPDLNSLRDSMERIGQEIALKFGSESADLRLAATTLVHNNPRFWLSCTIGKTLGKFHRILLMGFSLCDGAPHEHTLQNVDASFLHFPVTDEASVSLLRWGLADQLRGTPILYCFEGAGENDTGTFKSRAWSEWLSQRAATRMSVQSPEDFVSQGLEWALSF